MHQGNFVLTRVIKCRCV